MQEDGRKYYLYNFGKCRGISWKADAAIKISCVCDKIFASVLTPRFFCATIRLASENRVFAGVAQQVEQLIRNQQVMCSNHTTSSKTARFPRKTGCFSNFLAQFIVDQRVGQDFDPHRDPHAETSGKSKTAPERKLTPFPVPFSCIALYLTCAMKFPIFSAACSCICRVAWV